MHCTVPHVPQKLSSCHRKESTNSLRSWVVTYHLPAEPRPAEPLKLERNIEYWYVYSMYMVEVRCHHSLSFLIFFQLNIIFCAKQSQFSLSIPCEFKVTKRLLPHHHHNLIGQWQVMVAALILVTVLHGRFSCLWWR